MTLHELVDDIFGSPDVKDGGEVSVDCCFCDDGKERLGINVETGKMHCFKCDESSGDRDSVVNSKRRTFNKLCAETNTVATFTLDEGEIDTTVEKKIETLQKGKKQYEDKLPKAFEPLWTNITDREGKRARRYLQDRGITRKQIRKHKIGFCLSGYYAYRIIFPVWYGTKIRGLVGRDFTGESELKYLNSKGKKGLYGIPIRSRRNKVAILVEGVFDKLAVDNAGFDYDVIGGLGSKLSPKQIKQLSTYESITIWAEPDRAGVEGTIKRAKALEKKKVDVRVVLPDTDPDTDSDPGKLGETEEGLNEIRERISKAVMYTSGIASLMRTRVAWTAPTKVKKPYKKRPE